MNSIGKIPRLLRKILRRLNLLDEAFFIQDNPDFAQIEAGEFSYGKPVIMGADGTPETRVVIGKFCSIADGVRFLLRVNHPIEAPSTYPLFKVLGVQHGEPYEWSRGPISIGHDVWIGQDAIIFGGVTLGHGSIVAGHAVVTKDVPPYGIAAGNPARLVKFRFSDPIIQRMLDIRWWDWPVATIKEHAVLLSTGKVDQFLASVESISKHVR